MFINSSKIMFFVILMSGTMITVSANSWLGAWMGLEINLLSFIPLMSDNNNLMSTEASLKYFLTQALASTVFLFAVIIHLLNVPLIFIEQGQELPPMVIVSALLIKSGTAPFHSWFPNVMEGLTWMNGLILMTWQKIAPLMLLSYLVIQPMFISCLILSVVVGSLGGLNQTSIRKLMAYSSINHIGWMLAAMINGEATWIVYFLFYSLLSLSLVFLFHLTQTFHINQLFSMFFSNKVVKVALIFNLLSLGGLPPFIGFIPKWMVIQSMSIESQLFLMVVLTVTTLITLFFYLRLCFSAFMLNYHESGWLTWYPQSPILVSTSLILSFISLFGFVMISLLFFIY